MHTLPDHIHLYTCKLLCLETLTLEVLLPVVFFVSYLKCIVCNLVLKSPLVVCLLLYFCLSQVAAAGLHLPPHPTNHYNENTFGLLLFIFNGGIYCYSPLNWLFLDLYIILSLKLMRPKRKSAPTDIIHQNDQLGPRMSVPLLLLKTCTFLIWQWISPWFLVNICHLGYFMLLFSPMWARS